MGNNRLPEQIGPKEGLYREDSFEKIIEEIAQKCKRPYGLILGMMMIFDIGLNDNGRH
jgi:hypothetical protein